MNLFFNIHYFHPSFFTLLFTRCATSNASRHFKSPLAMGRDAFKPKHASSVSISGVIDTGVNSNFFTAFYHMMRVSKVNFDTYIIISCIVKNFQSSLNEIINILSIIWIKQFFRFRLYSLNKFYFSLAFVTRGVHNSSV